ncbi:unnamed protein product [Haemonchus placei]|uniref:4-(Cytidine 5'-diphospho)-2-C-methyl-D-erythritol kinase n=1 Tax=Haemonchus placei TaxID=6290 RepID=A0A0N4XBF1_HAEPC|nr:unnamed protein product [Haemonchus placei]
MSSKLWYSYCFRLIDRLPSKHHRIHSVLNLCRFLEPRITARILPNVGRGEVSGSRCWRTITF